MENDPDAAAAYEAFTRLSLETVADQFPDSSPAEQEEYVRLSQLLDLRNFHSRGLPIGDVLKANYQRMQRIAGRQHAAAQQALAPETKPAPAAPAKPASPTADRLRAASAKAEQRRAVSPTGRGSGPSGDNIDLNALSEDDYVELRLAGQITDAMQQARFSKPRQPRT